MASEKRKPFCTSGPYKAFVTKRGSKFVVTDKGPGWSTPAQHATTFRSRAAAENEARFQCERKYERVGGKWKYVSGR